MGRTRAENARLLDADLRERVLPYWHDTMDRARGGYAARETFPSRAARLRATAGRVKRRLTRDPGNVLRLLALLTALTWGAMFRTKSRSLLALLGLVMALAAAAIHENPALRGRLRGGLIALLTVAAVVNLMATMLEASEAQANLAQYLERAARHGERLLLVDRGTAVAALVSVDDLQRLEATKDAQGVSDSQAARHAQYRRLMEEAGLVTRWPAGERVRPAERQPIEIEGGPLSEQILADRR